ncbi:MAG: helix-turn-helix domain-containing protein [Victivallaceae bacterium]|nr:helix-turn-helix domain-containing protein [Victivallaceae bacterium]
MRADTKVQIIDFLNLLESAGKVSASELGKIKDLLNNLGLNKEPEETPVNMLTRDETAAILKVSRKTLERMQARGQIKAYRVGLRQWRYRLADIYSMLGN